MKKEYPKIAVFENDKGEKLHCLKLTLQNIEGYLKWRRKLFTEAWDNIQNDKHPNGYHHRAVTALSLLINLSSFELVMDDIDRILRELVYNSYTDESNPLYTFENFTQKHLKVLKSERFSIKHIIRVESIGFPVELPVNNQSHAIAYILIENESSNSNFKKFKESNTSADYFEITNFTTKDLFSSLLAVENIAKIYKHVKLWFETTDINNKYSEMFNMVKDSGAIPENVTIEPTGQNDKFLK